MDKLLTRLYKGDGTQEDLDVLRSVASKIGGKTLCALGDFATSPVLGTYRHFANEYEAKVKAGSRETAVPSPTD
ncbi:MAG: hypothetical protein DHS20C20_05550 [Ardenticatenaceae bacterium]|nr:MAG: hypothetical protein DHS20C20_05550 [Ardenticatenaceae bacterium]